MDLVNYFFIFTFIFSNTLFTSCSSTPQKLTPRAIDLFVGKSDPSLEEYKEGETVVVSTGGGCGMYGNAGTYDATMSKLKNLAASKGTDFVQIISISPLKMVGTCRNNTYSIRARFFFKKSSEVVLGTLSEGIDSDVEVSQRESKWELKIDFQDGEYKTYEIRGEELKPKIAGTPWTCIFRRAEDYKIKNVVYNSGLLDCVYGNTNISITTGVTCPLSRPNLQSTTITLRDKNMKNFVLHLTCNYEPSWYK